MSFKVCHLIAALLVLHSLTKVSSSILPPSSKKPNIIFILADDLGWSDVSYHGSGQIPTPNIDALALSGVILQNYYAMPLCTPSRTALMTGKHPVRLGMQHAVHYPANPYGLPLSEKLLPQHLKDLGYSTNLVGKWHLGHHATPFLPNSRGFDYFYGYYSGLTGYYDHLVYYPGTPWIGYDMRENTEVDLSAYGKYATSIFTEKTEAIIEAHDPSKPFFLYKANLAAHVGNVWASLQAPNATIAQFSHIVDPERRKLAAMVHELDQSIGRMVQALQAKDMLKDTIIVFSSDNGGPPMPRSPTNIDRNRASNWPLRGGKNTTWEGGVRVNGFVWSPLLPEVRRGSIYNGLMDISDWLPTLYEAAGGNVADLGLGPFDGVSHYDSLLLSELLVPSKREHLLHNIDDYFAYEAVRKGDYKLVKGQAQDREFDDWAGPKTSDNAAANWPTTEQGYKNLLMNSQVGQALSSLKVNIKGGFDLALLRGLLKTSCWKPPGAAPCDPYGSTPCLFNIADDPCEYNNLAAKMPKKVDELLSLIDEYRAVSVAPLNPFQDSSLWVDQRSTPLFWNCVVGPWLDASHPWNPNHKSNCSSPLFPQPIFVEPHHA